jgi:hypothetical protein
MVSHDDVFNTYHNLGDFFDLWLTIRALKVRGEGELGEERRNALMRRAPCCCSLLLLTTATPAAAPAAAAAAAAPCCSLLLLLLPAACCSLLPAAPCCCCCCCLLPAAAPCSLLLLQLDPSSMELINVDGLHPYNGKLMLSGQPDAPGPYFEQYRRWFGGSKEGWRKATDYGAKRVCFKTLTFNSSPRKSVVWDDFGRYECRKGNGGGGTTVCSILAVPQSVAFWRYHSL